ncbi:hypothetical protein FGM00_00240 [Aggregatimonas sangjinii]|uniref:Haemolysin activator HlyB C-terminal domain-containing protein n=1 Tax=Aggregatimonas sangjinii TaxID=2583587 RepID=A0A5B7SPR0_9FLAO|nr:ShlB/FhaC/HecB family hemolysin secretion/activation protein [Aggregatimonas sangjinii]QCW98623.1 hypothetical protein FGM00_00240 [Aggregatimonas sangjinii]
MTQLSKYGIAMALAVLCNACATFKSQYEDNTLIGGEKDEKISHSFFIASGAGNVGDSEDEKVLELLEAHLAKASEASTLLFTGDNISQDTANWKKNKLLLERQIAATKKFKGQTIFMPGANEWRSFDTNKIERVENFIKEIDDDDIDFYPENVCPITRRVISEQLDLIVIDSRWFISNWSRIKDMNKKCTDIVTRRRFIEELEGFINDGQDKNIVIAMHHPIMSNGKYAGKDSFKSHMTPLPIVGTLLNAFKELGAFSPDRLNSRRYNYLRIALSAYAKASDRITIVSGHEESLQYLEGGNIHQIIAGSLTQRTATRRSRERINSIGGALKYKGLFTYGEKGFTRLDYFEDGSSQVTFISGNKEEYKMPVLSKLKKDLEPFKFREITEKTVSETVLPNREAIEKSDFYTFLWGERYRKYFGESVSAPVTMLDTLYGGLKVIKEGGGHQSFSLRLEDANGKQYAMRSLRKNALKYLKFKIPGIAYTENDYDDSVPEEIVSDFFTTAHPYMQLIVNPLARSVQVNHSSPSLFYIPKQAALGDLNTTFGDELYFIEERPSDEQLNFKGYRRAIDEAGNIKDFESTTDMLERIASDESYTVDQREFIRARLFDMLIGDWDRHQDQWRWVEYEKNDGDREFLPVPRDRDNVFPKFDGFAIKLVKVFAPASRRFQSFAPEVKSLKWLNANGNKLDRAILTRFDTEVWEEEAALIQQNLTPEKIENAFNNLPPEVQDETSAEIRRTLELRLANLGTFAKAYSKMLNRTVALHGTEKDDKIQITALADGKTKVVIRRIFSDDPNMKIFERTFDPKETKELWIYGLGDDDVFEVLGPEKNNITIRLIGGYGADVFKISEKKNIKVYDWEHEETTFEGETPKRNLSNMYKTNTYHWRYFEPNINLLVPAIGFRTDDGVFLGVKETYTYKGFNAAKFRQKHSIAANYFFKFRALEASYSGIFAGIMPMWNFEVNGYYTNNRFSRNFFGFGNETVNLEDTLDRDFYRDRMQRISFDVGIAYHTLRFKALYESYRTRELPNRLFTPDNVDPEVFNSQNYVGAEMSALYDKADAKDFPSKYIIIGLSAGFKANTSIAANKFGYLKFKLGFSHKLIPSGDVVLGTMGEVMTNFGNDYFYYHAASIGGNNGLRGFRDERFSGKTYFYQTTDLRWRVKRYVTAVAPVTVGIYGGFDYGRVWQPNESSNIWHTSQGIGFWASGLDFITLNLGAFNSKEGILFQFGFGFEF